MSGPQHTTAPGRDVLLYDGHCGLCRAQIRRLQRLTRAAGFNPRGAVECLKRLRALAGKQPKLFTYFTSHPELDKRIENIEEALEG